MICTVNKFKTEEINTANRCNTLVAFKTVVTQTYGYVQLNIPPQLDIPSNFSSFNKSLFCSFLLYFVALQKTGNFFSFTFLPIFIANYIYNSLQEVGWLKAYCNLGVSSFELTPEFKTQEVDWFKAYCNQHCDYYNLLC